MERLHRLRVDLGKVKKEIDESEGNNEHLKQYKSYLEKEIEKIINLSVDT